MIAGERLEKMRKRIESQYVLSYVGRPMSKSATGGRYITVVSEDAKEEGVPVKEWHESQEAAEVAFERAFLAVFPPGSERELVWRSLPRLIQENDRFFIIARAVLEGPPA